MTCIANNSFPAPFPSASWYMEDVSVRRWKNQKTSAAPCPRVRKRTACLKAVESLLSIKTRPFPERVATLVKNGFTPFTRKRADMLFARCENLSLTPPFNPLDFDPYFPRVPDQEVEDILNTNPDNRLWIETGLQNLAHAYGQSLSGEILPDARWMLNFLSAEISTWEADSFPLDCMALLENRYGWTFSSRAWSLREQLRQESRVIQNGWKVLLRFALQSPILLILNQMAPVDYFTAHIPAKAAIFSKKKEPANKDILIYSDIKIASSEHRLPLEGRPEGRDLSRALALARSLDRVPVLCDLSRRRFSRAFLRAGRFARQKKIGIVPLGKVLDSDAAEIPGPKSARGFPVIQGSRPLHLFDPWPISDPAIMAGLSAPEKSRFCHPPFTKPWQDDRIGARREKEMNENGSYKIISRPWVVPVLGGWMRVDELFKSRLGRFLNAKKAGVTGVDFETKESARN